jgi:rhomboid family GlyGly-CTERM serine protease
MSDANRTHGLGGGALRTRRMTVGMWLVGLISATVVLLGIGGSTVERALRYERAAVLEAGEYWRLLTGHLVHLSASHMALNLAGLLLIAVLFPRQYSPAAWLTVGLISVATIDIGFLWNEPELEWYVGLSGVLHGALAAGAVAWWRSESRLYAFLLSVLLVGKLAWEQWSGALPTSGAMPVVVNAHLYGAVGGLFAALGLQLGRQLWPGTPRPL